MMDSSATRREAADASAAGGVTTETRETPSGDFSSTLLSQKSLFRVQTLDHHAYPSILLLLSP